MALSPGRHVREPAAPVGRVEIDVVEPGVAVRVAAAPLRLADVHVGVDIHAFGRGDVRDIRPDLEAGRLARPAGVFGNYLVCDLGAIFVAKGHDHGNFEGHILTSTVVYLIDHLDRIAPTISMVNYEFW